MYRFVSVIVSNLVLFDSLGRQQEVPQYIHYNGTLPAADSKKFPKRFAVEDEFFVFRGGNWERVVFLGTFPFLSGSIFGEGGSSQPPIFEDAGSCWMIIVSITLPYSVI